MREGKHTKRPTYKKKKRRICFETPKADFESYMPQKLEFEIARGVLSCAFTCYLKYWVTGDKTATEGKNRTLPNGYMS